MKSDICILNASNPRNIALESDEYVDLRDRSSCFEAGKIVKQCRSWHAWAYALETEFFVYKKNQWPKMMSYDNIIILVNRDVGDLISVVDNLKRQGKKVAISFHEGIQDLTLGDARGHVPGQKWRELKALVDAADFYLNIFGQYQEFFEGWFGEDRVKFVNHTAPFDWDHGLAIPWGERTGDILCGTRTFNQRLSRNTFVTLATLSGFAKKNPGRKVDFICEDGPIANIEHVLRNLGIDNIKCHQGPLKYHDWMKFLANYKYVAHHDQSMNLSQIVFDCVMLDISCVGSTGWLNQITGTSEFHAYPTGKWTSLLSEREFEFETHGAMVGRWMDSTLQEDCGLDKVKSDLERIFE